MKPSRQIKMLIFANAFTSSKSLGGGDRFLLETVNRLPSRIRLSFVLPHLALTHFSQKTLKRSSLIILKPNPFDDILNHSPIFLTYVIRTLQSIQIKKPSQVNIIYSATDFFTDVLPAWKLKQKNPKTKWVVCFFHFVPSPFRRPGNFFINIVAFLMQRFSLLYLKKADLIVVDNPVIKKKLIKMRFLPEKIAIAGGGIDFNYIKKYQSRFQEKFDAVFLGRLIQSKGALDIAPLWQKVIKQIPGAQLAIIGEGEKGIKDQMRKQIERFNLEKNITFFGFLPQKPEKDKPSVFDVLKSSQVFLFLDHEAGWGLAVAEAMACSLPVVGYNLDIFKTVFHQGFITVPVGNIQKASQTVSDLLKDDKKRKKLSQKAFEQAEALDWNKSVQQLVIHLENLVERQN